MKKIFTTAILILFAISAQAQELTWHSDIDKASEIAVKSKKPLMLFFTGSDWCGWCIRLQKEVFTHPEFIQWAKDNVVLVELDFPRRKQIPADIMQKNKRIEQMFTVRGYPTVWFVNVANSAETNVQFEKIGSTGYVAGGPSAWLTGANQILNTRKK